MPFSEPALAQKMDATGRSGLFTWQKILVSLRLLADAMSYSSLDDQSRMGIKSIQKSFKTFISAMLTSYGDRYLNRIPNQTELSDLKRKYAERLFPGCIGCIDCMHLH